MNKIFFLTGAFPPRSGGEFYNYKLYEYLEKAGLEPEYVDLYQKRKLFWLSRIPVVGNIFISLVLAILLHRCKGTFVEDHYYSRYLIFANIIQRFLKQGKVIVIVHHFNEYENSDHFSVTKFINKCKEKASLSVANLIVTVSNYTKDQLISLGINPLLIFVLPPGLDREKLSYLPSSEVDIKKIICVGNCIPRKGVVYLIEAFSQIERQGFTLHIVGKLNNTKYSNKLMALIEKLGLTKEIFFYDRVDQQKLNRLYSSSNLFVLPSLKEGFGIVLLEAMHYGLPIISTNISAIPELVIDGINGLLVPVANPQALAKAMSKLIEDPALRKCMGEKGRQRVTDFYYWDTTCAKFLSIVEDTGI